MSSGEDKTILMGGGAVSRDDDPEDRAAPKAKLVCLDCAQLDNDPQRKDLEFSLENEEMILGRDQIPCSKVSSKHARIFSLNGVWGVEDLRSTNGIAINDKKLHEGRLKPGDRLKIGPVLFQFVLLRPDADLEREAEREEPTRGDQAGGETVYGHNAAVIVIKADQGTKSAPPKEALPDRGSTASSGGQSSEKGHGSRWLTILFLLLLIGGGGYWGVDHFWRPMPGKNELVAHQQALKNFVADFEENSRNVSSGDVRVQLGRVDELRKAVEADASRFSQTPGYRSLMARLLFYRVEREIFLHVQDKHAKDAEPVIDAAANDLNRWSKPAGEDEGDNSIRDAMEMLALARDVIKIKIFKEQYPEPSAKVEKPSREALAAFSGFHQRFLEKKKSSKVDMSLNIHYPFFMHMVTRVVEEDLQVLPLWKEFIQ
ncbi:MAG: FHA domain-containing protein [Magnetococcales bacterium]|nr:FHA domain-containing protein [Magnetococcales bacterium]